MRMDCVLGVCREIESGNIEYRIGIGPIEPGLGSGVFMNRPENEDCRELLLDIICHEIRRQKLSPEMEHLFLTHLAECLECRTKVLGFDEVLGGWLVPYNDQISARN